MYAFITKAQPIASSLQQHVDLSTGDFNYNIPLMVVSGPNGEAFPLNIRYYSGIPVEQEASWVGLGWDLVLGEIKREVSGVPDDWRGKQFRSTTHAQSPKNFSYYGPIHFHHMPTNINPETTSIRMDVFASKRSMNYGSGAFEGPDYDRYYVSGPGIGGEIRPYLFDYANLFEKSETDFSYGDPSSTSYKAFTKKAQFRFKADGLANVTVPYYDVNSSDDVLPNIQYSGTNYRWSGHLTEWNDALKKPWDNVFTTHQFGGSYDPTITDERQRSAVSKYVEYFTNQEIYDHYNGTPIPGFIDFEHIEQGVNNCERNNSAEYDPDGIGAFRVTMPNGMVYHYSLPVYTQKKVSRDMIVWGGNSGVDYIINNRYANSWKLTAVTGPTYEDNAPLNVIDENDKGYWIKINYKQWSKKNHPYSRNYPYYGFEEDQSYREIPVAYTYNKSYVSSQASLQVVEEDIFYPHSIETATQTALFIKEVRKDNHSNVLGGTMPLLRLKNIVLLDREDANAFFQTTSSLTDSDFPQLTTLTNNDDVLHTADYVSAQSSIANSIDASTLQSVRFDYDYSLSRGVPHNIDNTISNIQSNNFPGSTTVLYQTSTVTTPSNTALGGKLTLQGIYLNGYGNQSVYNTSSPAFSFEYNTGLKNPDYTYRKDYFGFYRKFDFQNDIYEKDYLTDYSKDYVDAWALNKIITPLGGELEIEYESDVYQGTFYSHNVKESRFALKPLRANSGIIPSQTNSTIIDSAWGGGLRVKQLKLIEPDLNQEYALSFDYYTGYVGAEPNKYYVTYENNQPEISKYISDRFAPSTMVRYKTVLVRPLGDENLNGVNGRTQIGLTEYTFDNQADKFQTSHLKGIKINSGKHIEIKEFVNVSHSDIGSAGRLLKVRTRDRSGDVISTKRYNYAKSPSGSIKEMFYKYFDLTEATADYNRLTIDRVYLHEERHTYLKSIRTEKGDAISEVQYSNFDTYTGTPKETKMVENIGSSVEHAYTLTSTMAYTNYAEMGPKYENTTNKNLLLPTYEFKNGQLPTDEGYTEWTKVNQLRKLDGSGSYHFENELNGQWYPAKTYKSDGTSTTSNWQLQQHGTLFNENHQMIEERDLIGNFLATTYAGKHQLPISSATGSNYRSYFHSSFEHTVTEGSKHYFDSEINGGQYQQSAELGIIPHTGNYMAKVSAQAQWGPGYNLKRELRTVNGESIEEGLVPGTTYEASVWVHNSSPDASILVMHLIGLNASGVSQNIWRGKGKTHSTNITIGNWTLIRLQLTVPPGYTTPDPGHKLSVFVWNNSLGGEGTATYIDDFRLQPIGATVSATVYDEKKQLPTHVINNENFYTRFVHDATGNIIETYQETELGEKKIQSSTIHFAQ